MNVSRLLVPKAQPAWTRSMATAAFVLQDTLDLAVKSVSAVNLGQDSVRDVGLLALFLLQLLHL